MSNKFELTLEYPFVTAYKASLVVILFTPLRLMAALVFPLCAVTLGVLWLVANQAPSIFDVLMLFFLVFFTPIMAAFGLYLTRRKNKLVKGPFKYIFDFDGFHCSNENFSLLVKWSSIVKIRRSKEFIFIFTSASCAHAIAISELQKLYSVEEFYTFINSNIEKN